MKVADCSEVLFVYPFLFDPDTFDQRHNQSEKAYWQGRERSLQVWERGKFPPDDLLAHVRDYLNPPEGRLPTALLWKMKGEALQSWSGLGSRADWTLVLSRKEIPFQFNEVQLSLFRIGVGFVTIAAQPKGSELSDWLDFLHYFRFAGGERGVQVQAQRRAGKDQWQPFFPPPAGGIEKLEEAKAKNEEVTFYHILKAVLNTLALSDMEQTEGWWQEVFVPGQLIPFAVLYADSEDASDQQIAELLYRVRNFFPADRPIVPAPGDLRSDHPSLLEYAKRMWFVFSLEGGAFVAVNAPATDFFRDTLPKHLREQYFLLFLLASHQRFALMSLSQHVAEHWLQGSERERARTFERLRQRLLEFTARGYFAQVMQREHHHRVYRRWQETLQNEQLYREVSDEVREMHEYLLSVQTNRLERRINLLGAFIGIPALVFGFLSINLLGITAKEEGLSIWVASLFAIGGFLLGGVVWWLLSRGK